MTVSLTEKIVALHRALHDVPLPHAFGGALALPWCTQRARGTIDIDVNVFVPVGQSEEIFHALPNAVDHSRKDFEALNCEGQIRLWWAKTPVDLFLNTTSFHVEAAERVRFESFAGHDLPFLSCLDLAVFKAFYNRTKDWADMEEMVTAGTLDIDRVVSVLVRFMGADDERIDRLNHLHDL